MSVVGVIVAIVGAGAYALLGGAALNGVRHRRLIYSWRDLSNLSRDTWLLLVSAAMNIVSAEVILIQIAFAASSRGFPCEIVIWTSHLYVALCSLPLALRAVQVPVKVNPSDDSKGSIHIHSWPRSNTKSSGWTIVPAAIVLLSIGLAFGRYKAFMKTAKGDSYAYSCFILSQWYVTAVWVACFLCMSSVLRNRRQVKMVSPKRDPTVTTPPTRGCSNAYDNNAIAAFHRQQSQLAENRCILVLWGTLGGIYLFLLWLGRTSVLPPSQAVHVPLLGMNAAILHRMMTPSVSCSWSSEDLLNHVSDFKMLITHSKGIEQIKPLKMSLPRSKHQAFAKAWSTTEEILENKNIANSFMEAAKNQQCSELVEFLKANILYKTLGKTSVTVVRQYSAYIHILAVHIVTFSTSEINISSATREKVCWYKLYSRFAALTPAQRMHLFDSAVSEVKLTLEQNVLTTFHNQNSFLQAALEEEELNGRKPILESPLAHQKGDGQMSSSTRNIVAALTNSPMRGNRKISRVQEGGESSLSSLQQFASARSSTYVLDKPRKVSIHPALNEIPEVEPPDSKLAKSAIANSAGFKEIPG